VSADAAADRAGLLVGDVIVSVDGATIAHANDLEDRLAALEAGGTIVLGLVRGGAAQNIRVVTGAR
jgi:S1-C subfamily serine protease